MFDVHLLTISISQRHYVLLFMAVYETQSPHNLVNIQIDPNTLKGGIKTKKLNRLEVLIS